MNNFQLNVLARLDIHGRTINPFFDNCTTCGGTEGLNHRAEPIVMADDVVLAINRCDSCTDSNAQLKLVDGTTPKTNVCDKFSIPESLDKCEPRRAKFINILFDAVSPEMINADIEDDRESIEANIKKQTLELAEIDANHAVKPEGSEPLKEGMFHIETASDSDLKAIAVVASDSDAIKSDRLNFEVNVKGRATKSFTVCKDQQGNVLGYLMSLTGETINILNVAPEHRWRGIGTALVNAFIKNRVSNEDIVIQSDRSKDVHFWKKMGFTFEDFISPARIGTKLIA